jgi:hypothetical protein
MKGILKMRHMNKRKLQPVLDGLEGRLLLSTAVHGIHAPHHVAVHVGRAPSGQTTPINHTAAPTVTTLSDTSRTAPAIAQFNGKTYLAYVGVGNGLLNVESSSDGVHFGNKVILPELSINNLTSPALAVFNGRLSIAWTGGGNQLNIESSSDGVHFGNKATLAETSVAAPSLAAFNGRLYVGWTGLDGRLNLISTPDGTDFGSQVILNQHSRLAPSLAAYRGQLWIAFTGNDAGHHLNVISSSDGVHFPTAAVETSQTSLAAPTLTVEQPATAGKPARLVLAWTGIGLPKINYMSTTTNGAGFSGAVTTSQQGANGVAVGSPAPGKLDFGWSGLDIWHRLNFMELSA